jgi:ABC-type nitrate/sulfonate/bicarbonate transport system permease component
MYRGASWLLPLAGFAVIIALWQLGVALRLLEPTLVPSPVATLRRLVWLFTDGNVELDLRESAWRMALGYFPACAVGVTLGLVFGAFKRIGQFAAFVLEFIRSTPVTTLYPLFIVFCGLGNFAKASMVFVATCPPVILAAAYGVHNAVVTRGDMARLFGANPWQTFWLVRFFDAMPHIVVGLRTGLSYALIVAIVTELFMGTQRGAGQRIFEAYQSSQMPELFALIFLVGTIGWLLNVGFVAIERRVFHWAGQ